MTVYLILVLRSTAFFICHFLFSSFDTFDMNTENDFPKKTYTCEKVEYHQLVHVLFYIDGE